jgi:hypothetical protein
MGLKWFASVPSLLQARPSITLQVSISLLRNWGSTHFAAPAADMILIIRREDWRGGVKLYRTVQSAL